MLYWLLCRRPVAEQTDVAEEYETRAHPTPEGSQA